jgi:hypothetical protein
MNRRSFINFVLSLPLFRFLKFKQDRIIVQKSFIGPNWVPVSKLQAKFFGLPYHQNLDTVSDNWLGISREAANDTNTGTNRKKISF